MTVETSSQVCVRPEWRGGAELSGRALLLLHGEWVREGLLPDEDTEETAPTPLTMGRDLAFVQHRAAAALAVVADGDKAAGTPLRTLAEASAPRDAPPAQWPELVGLLVPYGEVATIGVDNHGRAVRERFLPGAVQVVDDTPLLLNLGHAQDRVLGRITSITETPEGAVMRARIIDSVQLAHETAELIRGETYTALSVEFIPTRSAKRIPQPDGSTLIEHSAVALHGAGVVPVPAYRSARIRSLLDRRECGRQVAADRRHRVAHLKGLTAGPTTRSA